MSFNSRHEDENPHESVADARYGLNTDVQSDVSSPGDERVLYRRM